MRGKLPNAQHYFNVSQEEELGQGGFLRVFRGVLELSRLLRVVLTRATAVLGDFIDL